MSLLFDSVTKTSDGIEYMNTETPIISDTEESVDYTSAIINGLKASYEASMSTSPLTIVSEGFTDMMVSLKKWFTDWLRRFKTNVMTKFMNLKKILSILVYKSAKYMKGRTAVKDTGKSIKVRGFEYDLSDKLNSWCVNDMISRINKATDIVEQTKHDLGKAINVALTEVGSTELFDKYRGSMVGKSAVSMKDFSDVLDRLFRKGSDRPKEITVDISFIDKVSYRIRDLQQEMHECYKEKSILENNVNSILAFLNKRPSFLNDNTKNDKIVNGYYISAKEHNNAIVSVYARAASSLKTTLLICEQFFNRKMIALSEAIRFYNRCVTEYSSGSVTESFDPVEDELDYVDEELKSINEAYDEDMIDDAILELFMYSNAWQAKQDAIAMEEANGRVQVGANAKPITQRRVQGIGNRLTDLVRRFLNFIGNIFKKFDQALGDIIKSDQQWLRDNAHYITDMPKEVLDTLTIHYSNYMHTNAHNRILERTLPGNVDLNRIVSSIGRKAVNAYANKTGDRFNAAIECYREFFPQLAAIDPDNWKNAAMFYYRGRGRKLPNPRNNPGQGETVTVKGPESAKVLSEMLKFCLNYKNYANGAKATLNLVRNAIAEQERHLNTLSKQKRELNSTTNEGMMYLDPEPYSVLENVYIVSEDMGDTGSVAVQQNSSITPQVGMANRPAARQNNTNNGNRGANNAPGTPSVAQANARNKRAQAQGNPNNPAVKQMNQVIDTTSFAAEQVKTAYTVCVAIATAKLTVCEEIYKSYMRVLRGVVDAIRRYEGNAEEDRSNAQYNKEQENEKHQKWMDKRIDIQRRNTLRAERRTGVLGALKNIIGG